MPRLLGHVRAISFLFALAVAIAFLPLTVPDAHAQISGVSVTLLWTATGDNGVTGQAAKYDLRYTANAVTNGDTLSWWNSAAIVNMTGHVPPPSGQRDSVAVTGLVLGKKYYAMLRIADSAGNWSDFSNMATIDLRRDITAAEVVDGAPKLVIGAPYPSPTSGAAQVALTVARSGPLTADVLDVRGRRVRSLHAGVLDAGPHVLRWDGATQGGARASAGVYWIRVAADGVQRTAKLIVLR